MSATARLRFMPVSPYKVRKYAQLFKGKGIEEARAILSYHPSPACYELLRLLNSAVANAENNYEYDPELMEVKNVIVDGAPSYKRWRARARGRVNRILKRNSHVLIEVDLREEYKVTAAAEEEEIVEEARPGARDAAKARKKTAEKPEPEEPVEEEAQAPEEREEATGADTAKEEAEAAQPRSEIEPEPALEEAGEEKENN